MKKMLKITLIVLAVLLILGYFFVQWANSPENVDALLKKRDDDRKQATTDNIKAVANQKQQQAEAQKAAQREAEVQQKTEADLTLSINETFANNRYEQLEDQQVQWAKFKDKTLTFNNLVYKKTSYGYVLALSREEYDHFVAEIELDISGDEIRAGLLFNHQKTGKKDFTGFEYWAADYVYSGLQYLTTNINRDTDNERLVSLKEMLTFKSLSKQKLRIEKKGKHLKISINGQPIVNKTVEQYSYPKGKIGIYIYTSNSSDWNESVACTIKHFKVWKW